MKSPSFVMYLAIILFALPILCLIFWLISIPINAVYDHRRGFKITLSGGRETCNATYQEGKKRIHFPGEHYPDSIILTVIDEVTWKREMPDWAKDRRNEIIERIVKELDTQYGTESKKCELKVIDLSGEFSKDSKWLREFIWPERYKR